MRLWNYRLIPVLPNAMLVSQWRECLAIKRQWEKGTLNHRLVSYVKDYGKKYFGCYVKMVVAEMIFRKINFNKAIINEISKFCGESIWNLEEYYYHEHNNRYLKQCYYNLQEKYDCGIITKEEWKKIEDLFKSEVE